MKSIIDFIKSTDLAVSDEDIEALMGKYSENSPVKSWKKDEVSVHIILKIIS